MPQAKAIQKGYSQILWLFPDYENDFFLTECGAMNLFVYWKNHDGIKELTTFPLEENLILPGITRDSLLHIARNDIKDVSGKNITGFNDFRYLFRVVLYNSYGEEA